MFFSFDGIKDQVSLSKDGVEIIGKIRFNSLGNAVSFIENNYPGIKKNIFLPVNDAFAVEEFSLLNGDT